MIPISRRDQTAVKQLLPLFDREITADPEQHDPARRAARREDIAQARIYFKEQRAAHEQKKDEELRAKLDSTRFGNPLQHANRETKPGAATPRLGIPANAGTIMMQPQDPRNTIIKVRSKRRPLTTILNPNPANTTTVPQIQTNSLTLSINLADVIAKSNTMSVSEDKSRGLQLGPEANMERSPKIADPPLVSKHQTAPKRNTPSPTSSRTMSAGTSAVELATPPAISGYQKSGLPVRAAMAQVTLINDVNRSELRSDESIQPEPGVHTTAFESPSLQPSDLQSRGHAPMQGLLDCKDHDVKRICGKVLVNGKARYVVRWKSDWISAELVHEEHDSGRLFVKGIRAKWYIKKKIGHRERGDIEEVKVRWVNTQEPPKYLNNAREAIRLFEAKQPRLRTNDTEYVRQRRILTIAESNFPLASVLPQSEEDYAASQRWIASKWPSIRPHETLDLYPAIYRIHMELTNLSRAPISTGKSYRNLMKLPQLRPLRWKSDYVASGRWFNGGKRRRASIFIQVTGVVTATQCTRCQGERITPFVGCVRTGPDDQLWLNGACANCGTQDNGDCNYHGSHPDQHGQSKRKSSTGYPKTSQSATSGNNLHVTNEGIDDSDDDSEGDDSDDSDIENDGADGGRNRAANSTLWPSSPPVPRIDGRAVQHIEATSSSTNGPSWSSSTTLNSSSSDTMASSPPSARRGKLPSVTKAKRLIAQKASGQSGLRARPSSSSSGVQKLSLPRDRDVATELNITNLDVSMSAIGASSSTTSRRRHSRDEFDPEPIEQDMLELSAKYDNSEPLKHRTRACRGVANPQAAGDTLRRKNSSEQRTDGGPPQILSRDRSITSSASFGPSSRKRAAPEPLLPERPPRPSFTSAANSVSILPERSVTAALPNMAAVQSIDTAPAATPKTFLRIENTAEINRDAVHLGCRLHQPCRDHEGAPPVPRNSRITVYCNTLSADRPTSLEEAEFILSQANCFWARRFTVLWESWCQEKGGIEREERSQVEWLVGSFPELLVRAARECCPKEVIAID